MESIEQNEAPQAERIIVKISQPNGDIVVEKTLSGFYQIWSQIDCSVDGLHWEAAPFVSSSLKHAMHMVSNQIMLNMENDFYE